MKDYHDDLTYWSGTVLLVHAYDYLENQGSLTGACAEVIEQAHSDVIDAIKAQMDRHRPLA